MTTATKPATSSPVQVLEQQKQRLANLQERHTRAQVRVEAERQNLNTAKAEAEELFGTSDLEALRQMFRERQSENERSVSEFIAALDETERQVAEIERQIKL